MIKLLTIVIPSYKSKNLVLKHIKKLPKSFQLIDHLKFNYYDAIIIGVRHKKFKDLGLRRIRKFAKKNNHLIFDLQNLFKENISNKISI